MKNIFFAITYLVHSLAFAQKSNPVADTLDYLYSISNTGFQALHPRHDADYEKLPLHILGADEVTLFHNGVFGYQLWLEYKHDNPLAPGMLKDIQKFLAKKEDNKDWAFQHFSDIDRSTLMYRHVPVFRCHMYDPGDETYYVMQIFSTTPLIPRLADEASYNNKFPAVSVKSPSPQIIQTIDNRSNVNAFAQYNGVFDESGFKSGRITFHGYKPFYEADFISQDWRPANRGRITAICIPANTHDTIYGEFLDSSLRDFNTDNRYTGYIKKKYYYILPDAPQWVWVSSSNHMEVYAADEKAQKELREKKQAAAVYAKLSKSARHFKSIKPTQTHSCKNLLPGL